MHRYIALVFFAISCVAGKSQAQSNVPFDSYDCRSEVEVMNMLVRKRQAMDQARLDSIARAHTLWLEATAQYMEDTVNGWRQWTVVHNFEFGKNRGELPMITSLDALHPYFRDKVIQLINHCRAKGIELAVVETYRTPSKQNEYKTLGKRYTRTGAGKSKHQYGLAVDVVPIVNGKAEWHNIALWRKIGTTGERLGLRWGGRWRRPFDPGHFEWTGGLEAEQLASGRLPRVPKQEELYPCLEHDLAQLKKYWEAWETYQSTTARQDK